MTNEKIYLQQWNIGDYKRGSKKHTLLDYEGNTLEELGWEYYDDETLMDDIYYHEELTYKEIRQFLKNIDWQRYYKKQKQGKTLGGYIIQAKILSGWRAGAIGYKVVEELADILPKDDEVKKIVVIQTKRGKELHIFTENHDNFKELTFKELGFYPDIDCYEIERYIHKFTPSTFTLEKNLFNFNDIY